MFRNSGFQTRRRPASVGARGNDCSGTKRRNTHSFSFAICILIICLGTGTTYGGTPQQGLPDGPGKELVARACSQCHSLDLVTSARKTQKAWQADVNLMWNRRGDFSETDIPKIVDYLYSQFGRDDTAASIPASAKSVSTYDFSKPPVRGTIVGSVSSDQGPVRAFRVTAHNLQYRVRYMVYTKEGHYSIPQALPGPYEIFGTETGFSSPREKVELAGGGSQTVNLAVKKDKPNPNMTYIDYDTVYPPGPGRDLLAKNCLGCHSQLPYFRMHLTEAGYRAGIETMRYGTFGASRVMPVWRTTFSENDIDTMAKYLSSNFGPNAPQRDYRRPEYPIDENVVSKAIFVQYDIPDELAQKGPGQFHDAFIASDRSIWLGGITAGMMVHLKPNALNPAERYKVYTTATDDAGPHGIAEDRQGHIYYAGLQSGTLGEIDTETGKVTEHQAPFMSGATLHSLWTDSKGNIWFSEIHGGDLGKYDPKTGHISSFTPPTADIGPYGLIEDLKGNIWVAALSKNIIIKLDPRTSIMTEYQTPTLGSGPRRIRMDSKGKLWFSESGAEGFGSIDPETGKITEYKLPVPNISPYSMWLDKKDEGILWGSDFWNGYSPFQYDLKTKKMMYYPAPAGAYNPETVVEPNNTVWFGANYSSTGGGGIHFYPEGYTASAPAEP